MIAEIIAAGSEMLTPFRQDTNSLYLTQGLNALGVKVAFKTIVGDNFEHLTGAARAAIRRADIVIFSGGLGPTEDDLTREAVAEALGIGMRRDNALLAELHKRFAARRIAMPPNNAKQADVLDGATLLENRNGSAAGQFLSATFTVKGGKLKGESKMRYVVLLPGPPKELKPMFDEQVRPLLAAALPSFFMARRQLRMALIPESTVDARTAPIYKAFEDVETTILAHSGEIQLHFECAKATAEEAEARVDALVEKIEEEMGDDVFSSNGESLEEVVLLMLGMRHLTLAVAESCTGGLLASRLTAIAGSSRYFLGGAVVYADELKTTFADVPAAVVAEQGPVSEAVVRLLAEGIRARTGASIGVGITGIAGPGAGTGADEVKPIGLVYVGLASEEGVSVKEVNLMGDRERIRWWATQHALEMLRRQMM
jgi:nicotinamide-nucleotide amidase